MNALDDLVREYFSPDQRDRVIAELRAGEDLFAPVKRELQAQIAELNDLLRFAERGARIAEAARFEVTNNDRTHD